MKRRILKNVLLALVCAIALTACNSHSKEIKQMNKYLEGRPCWEAASEYDYVFEDAKVKVREYIKFEHGKFRCLQRFMEDGDVLFEVRTTGKYEIEYDSDLEAYFFSQYWDDKFSINNVRTKDEWFKKFELEYRLNYRGDAYDSLESDDDDADDTLYGYEIVECTADRFILKDLETLEVYDYTPMGLDITKEGATRLL